MQGMWEWGGVSHLPAPYADPDEEVRIRAGECLRMPDMWHLVPEDGLSFEDIREMQGTVGEGLLG